MAKAKKNTRKSTKKTARKAKSQFYAVRSIRKATDNWMETAKDYNEKYVLKPFETGKDFVEDVRKDPRKVIEGLVDDGKGFVEDVRKDPRKVFNGLVDDGKEFFEGARKDVRKAIDKLVDSGKDFYKGVEKDTRKIVDGLVDNGKEFMDKIPLKKTIGEKINDGFEAVPARLNLPSKWEIQKLTSTMSALNKKVNALNKQYSVEVS